MEYVKDEDMCFVDLYLRKFFEMLNYSELICSYLKRTP